MGQIDQLLRRIAGAPVRTVRQWRSRGISWKVITSNLLPVPSLSIIHHQLLPSRAGNGVGWNLPQKTLGMRFPLIPRRDDEMSFSLFPTSTNPYVLPPCPLGASFAQLTWRNRSHSFPHCFYEPGSSDRRLSPTQCMVGKVGGKLRLV